MSSASIDRSETQETAEQSTTNQSTEDASPKSRRRKTSHLKLVPETLELREHLKAVCNEVASKLDKSRPLSKDEMETLARQLLEREKLGEGYVGWIMVMLSGAFWRDQVAATDPSRRLFLLPHCLKHAEGCPADYDEFGMNCKKMRGLQHRRLPYDCRRDGLQGTRRRRFTGRTQDHR